MKKTIFAALLISFSSLLADIPSSAHCWYCNPGKFQQYMNETEQAFSRKKDVMIKNAEKFLQEKDNLAPYEQHELYKQQLKTIVELFRIVSKLEGLGYDIMDYCSDNAQVFAIYISFAPQYKKQIMMKKWEELGNDLETLEEKLKKQNLQDASLCSSDEMESFFQAYSIERDDLA